MSFRRTRKKRCRPNLAATVYCPIPLYIYTIYSLNLNKPTLAITINVFAFFFSLPGFFEQRFSTKRRWKAHHERGDDKLFPHYTLYSVLLSPGRYGEYMCRRASRRASAHCILLQLSIARDRLLLFSQYSRLSGIYSTADVLPANFAKKEMWC